MALWPKGLAKVLKRHCLVEESLLCHNEFAERSRFDSHLIGHMFRGQYSGGIKTLEIICSEQTKSKFFFQMNLRLKSTPPK